MAGKRRKGKKKTASQVRSDGGEVRQRAEPPSPRRRPRWWLSVLFALVPALVLVAGLEGTLRLFGYGGSVALVVPVTCDDGTRLWMLNPESRRRFFFRQPRNLRIVGEATYRETFAYKKPPGTKRVFVVGGSAALGYPYGKNVSFAAYLRSLLERRYPKTRFEVINAGITAVSSYVVLDNVRELVRYSPDLIVVYSGHNEFYGTYAPTSTIGSWRWRPAVIAFMRFQRTKIYLLLKDIVGRSPTLAPDDKRRLRRAHLIGSMPRNEHIRLDGPIHRTVERNYRRNLEAMAAVARRHKVPLLFCTLAANERDVGPLRSWHKAGLDPDAKRRWQEAFDRGRRALADGATARAIESFSECVKLDPEYADAYFLLGRAFEKAGDFEAAAESYGSALDNDGMRFRADSRLNAIVRDVAEKARKMGARVALADVRGAIRDRSPHGLIGLDLVIDHVHLKARGIYLAAVEMLRAAEKNRLLGLDPPAGGEMPTFAQCNEDTGYNALDELAAETLMIQLFNDYPFDRMINREEVVAELERSRAALENSLDPIARAAYRAWLEDRATFIHNLAANAYYQAGRFAESAREVRTLLLQSDGYDAMTIGFLFHLYMCCKQRSDLDDAEKRRAMDAIFERARDLFAKFHGRPRRDRALQYLFMGKFYFVRGLYAQALGPLEKALELDPRNKDTYEFLIMSCLKTRRFARAESLARRLSEIDPGNQLAQKLLEAPSPESP